MRQPLESGELVIDRASATARYPARFQLVLAANPCPCGRAAGKGEGCSCSVLVRRRYLSRLSGPLLDRVDIQVDVPPSRAAALTGERGEPTKPIAARVARARERARQRWREGGWRCNAAVPGPWLRRHYRLPRPAAADLTRAVELGRLTLRGVERIHRLAWTLADLADVAEPGTDEVAQAMTLRMRGSHG